MNDQTSDLIPPHGGYRKLKSFQIAQLVYDVTVRFCDLYIERRSRTYDQMVQAARSGVQNIAEGSQASGTSKKTELKLTNVARASLEELRLDYEDFLRQRGLPLWKPDHPALARFKAKRCSSLEDVREWVEREITDEHKLTRTDTEKREKGNTDGGNTDEHGLTRPDTEKQEKGRTDGKSVKVGEGRWSSVFPSVLVANAALSLLNLCCYLLDRQLDAQAKAFEQEGGFTERLYKKRTQARKYP